MIEGILSLYSPGFATTIVYMLQSTEYQTRPYLTWFWRTSNFKTVSKRRTLDRTRPARLLLMALRIGMGMQIIFSLSVLGMGLYHDSAIGILLGMGLFLLYPVLWAHLLVMPLEFGRTFIQRPQERRLIAQSHAIFAAHKGVKIAVAGSYGKTTMKELLATVLGYSRRVAATPGNKNVSVSHAYFADRLTGDEDILIIEYGEGEPGDVTQFAATTKPDIGIITGLAPAHLDRYKTVEAAGQDIFALADYLHDNRVYVNGESPAAKPFIKPRYHTYTHSGVDGWKVSGVKLAITGTSFNLERGNTKLKLRSELVGRHQVGPLSAVAAIAHELGLSKTEIEAGTVLTSPYEHRLQPYQLGGAWIIDDTYNGNIEGVRAGLALLAELPAKNRRYVTPGLVDQGDVNESVHMLMGELIAGANPDQVVLMKNSVTDWIKAGLEKSGYKGQVFVEQNPLNFYTNLSHFVASGDLVLMQNDWTDNYN
jgi:UDP-N-acetylmuramyl pentapeptide synthase